MTVLPQASWFLVALVGVLGLAVGSFLNVVVHRVPAGLSVVRPASACPVCGHRIRPRDNVPVFSWLLLRGRCRDCGVGIPRRYPSLELGTGVLFAVVTWWVVNGGVLGRGSVASLAVVLVTLLYLLSISIALAVIDIETHTLPNRVVGPAYLVVASLLAVASGISGDWSAFLRAAVGLLILGGFYLVLALVVPGGMGFGDVKLAGVLGFVSAYLGWGPLVVGAFAAFLLGGTFAIGLLVTRRSSRSSGIPFGPWMVVGAWTGLVVGPGLWTTYLTAVGLG